MDLKSVLADLRTKIADGDAAGTEELLAEAERLSAIVPEIAIYMDGGLVQEVKRANDAPYLIHIHDHDVEGTDNALSVLTWPGGSEEDAILFRHSSEDDALEPSEAYWNSLRFPVAAENDQDSERED